MRWVGIDEAGYGPNLGPLVMTAVVAEGPEDRQPDLWADLPGTIARAGGPAHALWVDDSKKIYRAGLGFDRLEAASLATLSAAGAGAVGCLSGLMAVLGAGSIAETELDLWLGEEPAPLLPRAVCAASLERLREARPFEGASWRIVEVRSVVVGPARFNQGLAEYGSKAKVHYTAFARLLDALWIQAADGTCTAVRADKHGGRHFYLEPLYRTFPDAWIDRGVEGPELSHYVLRDASRRLELSLQPRADSEDGLVALASIVSKWVRELWMGVFNDHWLARIPGLKPTAGYPGDAVRFREAIEPHCRARAMEPSLWWRER
jgi:hypothetical protein